MFFDDTAIGPAELDAAVGGPLDVEPVFVHQPVVMAAEQYKIIDRSVAAIRPVPDVMRIDETAMAAAREAASAVARLQGTAQCRWYGPGLAADIEWIARVVFRYTYQAAVAVATARGKPKSSRIWTSQRRDRTRADCKLSF
jgi:hypothetical protein